MSEIVLLQHVVKGIQFYDYKDIAASIELGDTLTLKPEPLNPYDNRAIEIHHALGKLGHVARTETEKLHPYLDVAKAQVTMNEPNRKLLLYTVTVPKATFDERSNQTGS